MVIAQNNGKRTTTATNSTPKQPRTNWLHEIIRCIEFFFLLLECIILKLSQVKYIFFVECDNSKVDKIIFTVLQIP